MIYSLWRKCGIPLLWNRFTDKNYTVINIYNYLYSVNTHAGPVICRPNLWQSCMKMIILQIFLLLIYIKRLFAVSKMGYSNLWVNRCLTDEVLLCCLLYTSLFYSAIGFITLLYDHLVNIIVICIITTFSWQFTPLRVSILNLHVTCKFTTMHCAIISILIIVLWWYICYFVFIC